MTRTLWNLALFTTLMGTLPLHGCLRPPPDPATAGRLRQEAELLAAARDFRGAEEMLAKAIDADPASIADYLGRAELLEGLGRRQEARSVYKSGLSKSKPSDPLEKELLWRLALLESQNQGDPDRARRLMEMLPEKDPLREDVQGILALQEGAPRKAIEHFDAALRQQPSQEIKASLYYHASLAYYALGDSRNASSSLFHAVNNASHRGTIRGIEALWELLNAASHPGQAAER